MEYVTSQGYDFVGSNWFVSYRVVGSLGHAYIG